MPIEFIQEYIVNVSKNTGFFYRCTKDANGDPAEVSQNGGFRDAFCCQCPTSLFLRPPSSIPIHRSVCLKTASSSHGVSPAPSRVAPRSGAGKGAQTPRGVRHGSWLPGPWV